jgi:hypothetical protein
MPLIMRTQRVTSRLRSAVNWLRSSSRRAWLTSFLLVSSLGVMWGLANPPFAGPDEPAHVTRAHALDHGQLTGDEPNRQTKRGQEQSVLIVKAPRIYRSATGTLCFPFHREITASCLRFVGATRDTNVATSAARHPPAYYGVVGVASWLDRPGSGTVYLMRFIGALIMGAFVATAINALRRSAAPRLVATGLLLAFTPMVLFVSGVVNPSVPEVAASLTFWVAGLVLVSGSHQQLDKRLVTVFGIAGCVLALSRQLGPLWVGLIALTLLCMTSKRLLVNLARSNWARLWGALIVAAAFAQTAWDVVAKPLDVAPQGPQRTHFGTAEVLRNTFGATFSRVREMIGAFGWLDTPSPALTWVPWIGAVGFLFLLAVMWARRRDVVILLALLTAVIAVPALLESARYEDSGGYFWQGRYTLPLAVGLPVLATIALSSTESGRQLATRRLLFAIGAVVSVAHVVAFAQNLRRYTVGYDGEIQYWRHPEWSPPVSPLLLTVAYTVVLFGFVCWVFASTAPTDRISFADPVQHLSDAERAATTVTSRG